MAAELLIKDALIYPGYRIEPLQTERLTAEICVRFMSTELLIKSALICTSLQL